MLAGRAVASVTLLAEDGSLEHFHELRLCGAERRRPLGVRHPTNKSHGHQHVSGRYVSVVDLSILLIEAMNGLLLIDLVYPSAFRNVSSFPRNQSSSASLSNLSRFSLNICSAGPCSNTLPLPNTRQ